MLVLILKEATRAVSSLGVQVDFINIAGTVIYFWYLPLNVPQMKIHNDSELRYLYNTKVMLLSSQDFNQQHFFTTKRTDLIF